MTAVGRYPLPTASGTANNYRHTENEVDDQDQWDARVDRRFSNRDRSARASRQPDGGVQPGDRAARISGRGSGPGAVLGAANFGTITTAFDPRVVQLALKFVF
jgi:hypothetical protein